MDGIPAPAQAPRLEFGLEAHGEQERADGVPGGRRLAALDPADGGLRGARAQRECALAQTERSPMPLYDLTQPFDT
jgi:hypothetical protein